MEGSERSVGSWWGCCGEGFENSGEREASLAGSVRVAASRQRRKKKRGVAARREKEEGAGGSGKG